MSTEDNNRLVLSDSQSNLCLCSDWAIKIRTRITPTKHRLKPHSRIWSYPKKRRRPKNWPSPRTSARLVYAHLMNARREMCVDLRLRGIPELGGAETHNAATGWCLERFEQKEKTRRRSKHPNFFFFLLCVCDVLRSALRNGIEDGRRYRVLTKIPREWEKERVRTLVAVILTVSSSPTFWCTRSRF